MQDELVTKISEMKVFYIRKECEKRGLETQGMKNVLVTRLINHITSVLNDMPEDDKNEYTGNLMNNFSNNSVASKYDDEYDESFKKVTSHEKNSFDHEKKTSYSQFNNKEFLQSLYEKDEPVYSFKNELNEDYHVLKRDNCYLDEGNSDLHCILSDDGLEAYNLIENSLKLLWAGSRANYGIVKDGKYAYECKIIKQHNVELSFSEKPSHAVRVGWSSQSTSLQLGLEKMSFGLDSSGWKTFAGKSYPLPKESLPIVEGDVITSLIEIENGLVKWLGYLKNGKEIISENIASSKTNESQLIMIPHIFIKNMKVEMNFGSKPPFFELPDEFKLIDLHDRENFIINNFVTENKADCEVIVMCGVPSCGKTTWVSKKKSECPSKNYYVISTSLLRDRFRLLCEPRIRGTTGYDEFHSKLRLMITKFLYLASLHNRNYIIDMNNSYSKTRQKICQTFSGFNKICISIIINFPFLRQRSDRRNRDFCHDYNFSEVTDFKLYFSIPTKDEGFDQIVFPELQPHEAEDGINQIRSEAMITKERRSNRNKNEHGDADFQSRRHSNSRDDYEDSSYRYSKRSRPGDDMRDSKYYNNDYYPNDPYSNEFKHDAYNRSYSRYPEYPSPPPHSSRYDDRSYPGPNSYPKNSDYSQHSKRGAPVSARKTDPKAYSSYIKNDPVQFKNDNRPSYTKNEPQYPSYPYYSNSAPNNQSWQDPSKPNFSTNVPYSNFSSNPNYQNSMNFQQQQIHPNVYDFSGRSTVAVNSIMPPGWMGNNSIGTFTTNQIPMVDGNKFFTNAVVNSSSAPSNVINNNIENRLPRV